MADTEEEKKRKEEEKKIKAEEKRIKDLRDNAVNIIERAINSQNLNWNNLRTDIDGAEGEFTGRQFQLLWEGLQKVANPNSYPLWMDIILTVAATAFPVNALVAYAGKKILFSRKLLGIPIESDKAGKLFLQESFVKSPKQALQLLTNMDKMKSYERWASLGKLYAPEIEDTFRNLIKTAVQTIPKPLFDNEEMTNWMTKSQKPSKADNTGLPSVDVLTGMRKWINTSQYNDTTTLTNLKLRIEKETNELLENGDNILLDPKKKDEKEKKEVFIKEIHNFINEEAGLTQVSGEKKSSPYQNIQRFVESCLWCTTYDFKPTFVPSKTRTFRIKGDIDKIVVSAEWKLLPFSKAFWDNLISRHYDPFMGNGSKTYKEIGPNRFIAPGNLFNPETGIYGVIPDGYPEPDPATRLSFQWSMVLAPSLLNENSEAAAILEKYFPP